MPSSNIAELAFAIQTAKGSAAAASAFRIRLSGGAFLPEPDDRPELSHATSTGRVALSAYVPAVRARVLGCVLNDVDIRRERYHGAYVDDRYYEVST